MPYCKICGRPQEFHRCDDSCVGDGGPLRFVPEPEALQWLRSNPNPSALATNRFQTTASAIAFVESLYAAGALRVSIPDENMEQAGPYADSLRVELPEDPFQRQAVLSVVNEIGRPEADGEPIGDRAEDCVELWWD